MNIRICGSLLLSFGLSASVQGPGYLSRYSDSLRTGQFGDRIPVGGEVSPPVQTVPVAHPASLYNGHRLFSPGVKRPGRGVNHPPTSSVEGKERVDVYLYYTSGRSLPVLGRTLHFIFTCFCSTQNRSSFTRNHKVSPMF